ncbi:MAG: helix-turn-helix domain-containing protein [Actinobacteria bacterium]|nr:helix-turn-helix domain-containing protein [Actinomycetota bacterium]
MFEIGNSLRETRLRQGLDFPELEHATKIRGKYLRDLEDERFELLPSHTYVKGFLRSYADHLGLDGQLYVDEYNSRYVIGEDDAPLSTRRVPAARRRKSDRRESSVVLLALTSIAIVTALVIAAWRFGEPDRPTVPGLQETAATSTAARTPSTPAATGTVTLEITATRGDSFVDVRRGDAIGIAEFNGTIERGQKQRFTGRVLWLQVRTPKNVVVRVNGNRVGLVPAVKTRGVYVTAQRIVAADPG